MTTQLLICKQTVEGVVVSGISVYFPISLLGLGGDMRLVQWPHLTLIFTSKDGTLLVLDIRLISRNVSYYDKLYGNQWLIQHE